MLRTLLPRSTEVGATARIFIAADSTNIAFLVRARPEATSQCRRAGAALIRLVVAWERASTGAITSPAASERIAATAQQATQQPAQQPTATNQYDEPDHAQDHQQAAQTTRYFHYSAARIARRTARIGRLLAGVNAATLATLGGCANACAERNLNRECLLRWDRAL
jgi:hypothetical protein